MSRVGDDDYEEMFPNAWALWERSFQTARTSKRGLKALHDLRDALLALPEKRLISRALCTVGKKPVNDRWGEQKELLEEEGPGVCTVGAYAWHKRVQSGMSPIEAFKSLPLAPDFDGESDVTAKAGTDAGLAQTISWWLMGLNDNTYGHLTPEARYEAVLAHVEQQIAEHPLTRTALSSLTSEATS